MPWYMCRTEDNLQQSILFLPCGIQELNMGHQACQQVSLLVKSPVQLLQVFCLNQLCFIFRKLSLMKFTGFSSFSGVLTIISVVNHNTFSFSCVSSSHCVTYPQVFFSFTGTRSTMPCHILLPQWYWILSAIHILLNTVDISTLELL